MLALLGRLRCSRKKPATRTTTTSAGRERVAAGTGEEEEHGGPRTVKEAREQGRGYRIGAGGMTPSGGRDIHVVRDGDTLWDISQHYYGDPWKLARAVVIQPGDHEPALDLSGRFKYG